MNIIYSTKNCNGCGGEGDGFKCSKCGAVSEQFDARHRLKCGKVGEMQVRCKKCGEAESNCRCNMDQKGLSAIALLVIVAVVFVGGYLVFTKKTGQPMAQEVPTGWRTYSGERYGVGFSLAYPSNFALDEIEDSKLFGVLVTDLASPEVTVEGSVGKVRAFAFVMQPKGELITQFPADTSKTAVSGVRAYDLGWRPSELIAGVQERRIYLSTNPIVDIRLSARSEQDKALAEEVLASFKFSKMDLKLNLVPKL